MNRPPVTILTETDLRALVPLDMDAMIEREPLTVILSKMGWIRAMKGHQPLEAEVKFRDGDGPLMALHAETSDKLVVFGANGRFYTLPANNLPGGRGLGEPLRLMDQVAAWQVGNVLLGTPPPENAARRPVRE